MKIFTTLLLLYVSGVAHAQQPERKLVNTCGETYSNQQVKLKVSVGEPVVGMLSTTSGSLSQGFLQSKPAAVVVPPPVEGYSFYPNPVKEAVQVKGDITKVKQLQVYDAAGKIITTLPVTASSIQLNGLAAGVYTGRLIGDNGTIIYYAKLLKL
jgi:Secretion system C-terminal sorting domain